MSNALMTTVGLLEKKEPKYIGKVRDTYEVGEDCLVMVATDRISAFDVVIPNGIPDKGRVLTGLTIFWNERLREIMVELGIRSQLITSDVMAFPPEYRHSQFQGRSMLVYKVMIPPVECIVRGYLAGSAWKEYRKGGTVNGIELPSGLRESDKLPEPLFTPSTKAVSGHDENIHPREVAQIIASSLGVSKKFSQLIAKNMANASISLYEAAADYARECGIIIADTKFEFGVDEGCGLVLADEVLTPDSSRFWPVDQYEQGRSQDSFDKQYVRDYLETLNWNKTPPAPALPNEVIANTRAKYLEAYRRLVGVDLAE